MKVSLIILTIIFFLSCEKNFTSVDLNESGIISLSIGNKYLYYESSAHGDSVVVLFDWFSHSEIISDTIILGSRYFNFNNEEFLRLDGKKVIKYSDNGNIVKFDFEVDIGDTVYFQGNTLIVSEVAQEPILEDLQKVFRLTNVKFKPDTIVSISYSTKFGLVSFGKNYSDYSTVKYLVGAKISSQEYGNMW